MKINLKNHIKQLVKLLKLLNSNNSSKKITNHTQLDIGKLNLNN